MSTATTDIDVVYPESDGRFEAYLKKDEARRPRIEMLEQMLAEAKLETEPARNGRRTYLIRGEIREQGFMHPPHAALLGIVYDVLRPIFTAGYRVRLQTPVVLGDSSPFPDIAVVKGTLQDFKTKHPTTAELIVEIADSSLFEDTTTKAEVYATGGILDYWVLDVENRLLLVFRDPAPLPEGGLAYRTCLKLKEDESISPLAQPSATIRVRDLLV